MLPRDDSVTVNILNIKGEEVIEPFRGYYTRGHHSISPKLDNLPSGVYFYQILMRDTTETRKMILLK